MNAVCKGMVLVAVLVSAGTAIAQTTTERAFRAEKTVDPVRQQCMARVNDLVPVDFPRWREHLLEHCIEKGGKL